jgi:predicted GIY-YIG superfamily endonuclease
MDDRRFVYVLESLRVPPRHYVGLTSDVKARLAAHNAGLSPHTSKHAPWRVLVAVEFAELAGAVAFERYLKSGSGRALARRDFAIE